MDSREEFEQMVRENFPDKSLNKTLCGVGPDEYSVYTERDAFYMWSAWLARSNKIKALEDKIIDLQANLIFKNTELKVIQNQIEGRDKEGRLLPPIPFNQKN